MAAVSLTSTVVSNVVTYNETIALINPPVDGQGRHDRRRQRRRPDRDERAVLPSAAITTTGTVSTVELLQNGKTTVTRVTTGLVGNSDTQILSGLKAGEVVVEPTVTVVGSTGDLGDRDRRRLAGFGGGGVRRRRRRRRLRRQVRWRMSVSAPSRRRDGPSGHRPAADRQDLPDGRRRGHGAAGRVADGRARRLRRDHGRLRVGQVDDDEHPRLPRRTLAGASSSSTGSTCARSTRRRCRTSATARSGSSSSRST